MVEHILRGGIGVAPAGGPGKQVTVVGSAEHLYTIPLSPEVIEELTKQLLMPNDELAALIDRKQAAQKLALPGQGPAANGNGHPIPQDLRREQ